VENKRNSVGRSKKQPLQSCSAKPSQNSRHYKFFLFKFKSSNGRKKKPLAPVQGVRYNSRPVIYPQEQKKSFRSVKNCIMHNNDETKMWKFNGKWNQHIPQYQVHEKEVAKLKQLDNKYFQHDRRNIKSGGNAFLKK